MAGSGNRWLTSSPATQYDPYNVDSPSPPEGMQGAPRMLSYDDRTVPANVPLRTQQELPFPRADPSSATNTANQASDEDAQLVHRDDRAQSPVPIPRGPKPLGRHKEKQKTYSCAECGQKFSKAGGVERHKLTKHNRETIFICHGCEHSTFRKDRMKDHCQKIHENPKAFHSSPAVDAPLETRRAEKRQKGTEKLPCHECGGSGRA